jgi:hypothetical protein
MEVSDRPSNIDQAISIKPEPPQNDGNAFVMPWRKKDVVASAKMTPKDMGMCIDVKGKSYSIYLRCLRIFACVCWSLVEVYEDSRVCLSRAQTKTTIDTFRGTFTCISHSSTSRGIFLA